VTKPDLGVDGAVADLPADQLVPDQLVPDKLVPDQQVPDSGVVTPPNTWVTIPKGTFTMGAPTSEPCRESFGSKETQHQVTLTHGFELQATEVTQSQFSALMGYNPAYFGPNGLRRRSGTDPLAAVVEIHFELRAWGET
jgi:formylglycine-generating enzyme required for sulfatase activity